jgi:hypothetical protein
VADAGLGKMALKPMNKGDLRCLAQE